MADVVCVCVQLKLDIRHRAWIDRLATDTMCELCATCQGYPLPVIGVSEGHVFTASKMPLCMPHMLSKCAIMYRGK